MLHTDQARAIHYKVRQRDDAKHWLQTLWAMWGPITQCTLCETRDEQCRRIQTQQSALDALISLIYLYLIYLSRAEWRCISIPHLHLNTFSNLQHKSNVLFSAGEAVWCAMPKAMCAREWEWQMYATISTFDIVATEKAQLWPYNAHTADDRVKRDFYHAIFILPSLYVQTQRDPNKTCIDKFDKMTCAQVESCVQRAYT